MPACTTLDLITSSQLPMKEQNCIGKGQWERKASCSWKQGYALTYVFIVSLLHKLTSSNFLVFSSTSLCKTKDKTLCLKPYYPTN